MCAYITQIGVAVREQLLGTRSLLLLCESLRSNLGPHTWKQEPSPAQIFSSPSTLLLAFQDRNKEGIWDMAINQRLRQHKNEVCLLNWPIPSPQMIYNYLFQPAT